MKGDLAKTRHAGERAEDSRQESASGTLNAPADPADRQARVQLDPPPLVVEEPCESTRRHAVDRVAPLPRGRGALAPVPIRSCAAFTNDLGVGLDQGSPAEQVLQPGHAGDE